MNYMDEKKIKRRNLVLRILIYIAAFMGLNAVRGFFYVRAAAGVQEDSAIFAGSASLAMDYLTFLVLSIVIFVMNFVARHSISKKKLIIRSIVLGLSVVLIWYSAPSISYIAYMGISRFEEMPLAYPVDIEIMESYISGNLWTVFSYMVSAAAYAGMTVISIVSLVKGRKR